MTSEAGRSLRNPRKTNDQRLFWQPADSPWGARSGKSRSPSEGMKRIALQARPPVPPLPTRACINQQPVMCMYLDEKDTGKNVAPKALQAKQEILAQVGVPSKQVAVHPGGIHSYSNSTSCNLQRQ